MEHNICITLSLSTSARTIAWLNRFPSNSTSNLSTNETVRHIPQPLTKHSTKLTTLSATFVLMYTHGKSERYSEYQLVLVDLFAMNPQV